MSSRAPGNIRALLENRGRLNFSEFMTAALYGPEGYYVGSRNPFGASGDFYTSPLVHPAFGTLLAVQVAQIWELMKRPASFAVSELGGGNGIFARDFCHAMREHSPKLASNLCYTVMDYRPPNCWPGQFRPASSGLPSGSCGVVFGNEFLDALPVHRVIKLQGKLQELYVELAGDRLVEHPGPLSSATLAKLTASWVDYMPEGGKAEVPLALAEWIPTLANALEYGVVLLIDYGAELAERLADKAGTLRSYRQHRIQDDLLANAGAADLTYQVDFTALRDLAMAHGLTKLGESSQEDFLKNLGWEAISSAIDELPLDSITRQANLVALRELVAPGGLGGHRVIALGKGIAAAPLFGFDGGGTPTHVPLLTKRHMLLHGKLWSLATEVISPENLTNLY
ncbi:MAG: SAM-dependent methyltransferase [Cyanobacteria bacterium NC_groundwater_1444_Ag_S-0.65um_54_12]|nr:SAM-dependent methyltransferase [Cyanobacteria bacterium NC_groundwater_1444_Ag_S-0.65um_54_12]